LSTPHDPAPVRAERIETAGGHAIGRLTLDHPSTLNALTPAIVAALDAALRAWAADPSVVAVWLDSSSEKAFSAGANLQALYRALRTDDVAARDRAALDFFAPEYRLDHFIHHYPKPVVAWMHGIVMGGGVGLACGASHRVVTGTTKFAMPEITIGLFPDVGGSWFLQRMPARIGRYLALTGARLGPADTIALGMADLPIPQASKQAVLDAMAATRWDGDAARDRVKLDGILDGAADWAGLAAPEFMAHQSAVAAIAHTASPVEFHAALEQAAAADPWFEPHRQSLAHGSPASAGLSWTLLERLHGASLAEVLQLELAAAMGCATDGDFVEGIRALIVDKDRSPKWRWKNLGDVGEAEVATLLAPRWTGPNPLADLVG
jgi:enoyl-CoA hydratase/carnithine racemase